MIIARATLKDGTRAAARGGVYMRSIVCVRGSDEATYVRADKWTRYRDDGRHARLTGRGTAWDAPEAAPIPLVHRVHEPTLAEIKAEYARRWPAAMAFLEGRDDR